MKRVLIVDDAIDVCRMLQDALKTAFPEIRVSVMPSGEEALLEASRLIIDLLVTDIRLPGMTGFELVRKIRVRQPQVKVILMSGIILDEHLEHQRDETAANFYFRKPLHVDDFLEAVASLTGENARTDESPRTVPMPVEMVDAQPALEGKRTGSQQRPSEPQQAVEPVEQQSVSTVLSRLRGSLGAESAMLLDDRGHPVALAGDLPEFSLEDQLFPPVMSAVSAGAKLSYLIGQPAIQSVQAYRGEAYDLILAPVGQYVLMIVLRTADTRLRLALAFEEAFNARDKLASALEAMGLHIQSAIEIGSPEVLLAELERDADQEAQASAESAGAEPEAGLDKFEELFSGQGVEKTADPDSFWESASGENEEISQPGVLSFEQASKLGLVPKDEI